VSPSYFTDEEVETQEGKRLAVPHEIIVMPRDLGSLSLADLIN
jgi:hypothetical protein